MTHPAYLLDTNILSAVVKQPDGQVTQRMSTLGNHAFCTSIIVACELRYGIHKKGSPNLTAKIEKLLAKMTVLPLDGAGDVHYAEVRVALEKIGQPIGHNDLLIAAHARSLGLTLVTDNTGEFSRVPGLAVENWLSTDP